MPTVRDFRAHAGEEPLTVLTAYDALTAQLVDEAGVDAILVGDSMGNAVLGYDTTLPVTMEDVASRTAAVARGADEALVIADMPFLSVGVSEADSVSNAGRMIKDAGADAVKLESGEHTVDLTERLVELGIPVMAHLGLTPQHVKQLGGFTQQGSEGDEAARILDLAERHEAAGAFSLVLEHVPASLARRVSEALGIPVIGIGAGPDTDGQVLVITDVLGLSESPPPFAAQFGDARAEFTKAIDGYQEAVKSGTFPPSDDDAGANVGNDAGGDADDSK